MIDVFQRRGFRRIGRRPLATHPTWTVIDAYARALGTRGHLPPALGVVEVWLREVFDTATATWLPFALPLEAAFTMSPSGTFVFLGYTVANPRAPGGPQPRRRLAEARYRTRVVSELYQDLDVEADLSADAHLSNVELKPGYAYPFPQSSTLANGLGPTRLRGVVLDASQRGIADVTVTVLELPIAWPFRTYRTDATGQWVIVAPDSFQFPPPAPGETVRKRDVTVRIEVPNEPVQEIPNVTLVQGHEVGM